MTLAYGLAGLFCQEVLREVLVQRQQDTIVQPRNQGDQ